MQKRVFLLTQYLGSVRQWHWISSAICLIGMLLFAITGITLNHADQIGSSTTINTLELTVPDAAISAARNVVAQPDYEDLSPLPQELKQWLDNETGIRVGGRSAEWDEFEVYLAMPKPGGDAWLSIDLETGELIYENTSRGAISYFNDLHKGRNTGSAWKWFLDIFSVTCVIFCGTGLLLLQRQTKTRPSTWPMVGLGTIIPLLIALLFIH